MARPKERKKETHEPPHQPDTITSQDTTYVAVVKGVHNYNFDDELEDENEDDRIAIGRDEGFRAETGAESNIYNIYLINVKKYVY